MPNKTILLTLAMLTAGCNVTVRDDYWQPTNRTTVIIAAQTRRAQLIAEQERLERLLRRTVVIEDRAVIQSNINRQRFEIEQLNAIIE